MRKHEEELRTLLYEYHVTGYLTDMVIVTGTGEVRAHMAAVMAKMPENICEVFLEARTDDGEQLMIVAEDWEKEVVEEVLKRVYLMADATGFMELLEVKVGSKRLKREIQVKVENPSDNITENEVDNEGFEDGDHDEETDGAGSLTDFLVDAPPEKPYICNICTKTFSKKVYLKHHLKRHEAENSSVSSCSKCKKLFPTQAELKEHRKVHRKENRPKLHVCEQCSKSFAMAGDLKVHYRKHTGEKPFACSASGCSERFTQAPNLQSHIRRRHTNERPFSCDRCGMCFTHNKDLRLHILKHNSEKPFSCDECGKRFYEAGSLKKHKMTHSGEKPFLCSHCAMTFARAWNLEMHKRTHTGYKPNICKVCQKSFTRAWDLSTHMRTHNSSAKGEGRGNSLVTEALFRPNGPI